MAAQQTAAPVDQELIVSLVKVCQSVIHPVYALYIRLILVGDTVCIDTPPTTTIYGSCIVLEETQQVYSEIRHVGTCGLVSFPLSESFRSWLNRLITSISKKRESIIN